MTQVELTSVLEQIGAEIEVDAQGKGKASIRATARLAGVSDMALRKAFKSANSEPSELAKKLIKQGFDAANFINWSSTKIPDIAIALILEYYALDAGRFCTEQAKLAYKAFAAIGIRTWMQQIKGWQEPIVQRQAEDTHTQQPTAKDISEAIAAVFCFNTIDLNLVQGLIANEIGKAHPQLKSHMEAAKQLLPSVVNDELLTVTNLAKLYIERTGKQLSKNNTNQGNAIAMNEILTSLGLQVKNPNPKARKDGQPIYLPTEKGKQYCKIILQEASGNNKTIQQLRWFPSVLDLMN